MLSIVRDRWTSVFVASVFPSLRNRRCLTPEVELRPAFRHEIRQDSNNAVHRLGVVVADPAIREAMADAMDYSLFPTSFPMLVPPRPWSNAGSGAYLKQRARVGGSARTVTDDWFAAHTDGLFRSFVRSCVRLCVCSFVRLFVCSFCSFVR